MQRQQILQQRQAMRAQYYPGYAQPGGMYGPPPGAYMGRRRGGGGVAMPVLGGLAG